MFFDPMYLIFAIPGLILSMIAGGLVKSTFAHYAQVRAASGMTGAQAAKRLLQTAGIRDVTIEEHSGFLSDHYDPSAKALRLSPDVYGSSSLSAIGVACHEAGHAIQHARLYAPLKFRTALVPLTQFSNILSYIIIVLGFVLNSGPFILAGCILFSVAVLFTLVTLPVEWDASARAKELMVSSGIVNADERDSAAKVLNAAFLTYVAAAVTAIMTLLYYLMRYSASNRD